MQRNRSLGCPWRLFVIVVSVLCFTCLSCSSVAEKKTEHGTARQAGGKLCPKIFDAARTGNVELLKELMGEGCDPNVVSERSRSGREPATPLHEAVRSNHLEVAQLLIAHGADIDTQSMCRRRKVSSIPLYEAAKHGYKKMVELLIRNGADVNATCSGGWVPLFAAIDSKKEALSITTLLIENGADVNATTPSGNFFPLLSACMDGKEDLIELLVENGADVNMVGDSGRMPLGDAVKKDNKRIVEFLQKHGAIDPYVSNIKLLFKGSSGVTGYSHTLRKRTIKRCYVDTLKRHPCLAGSITIQLDIEKDGKLKDAFVVEQSYSDARSQKPISENTLGECILKGIDPKVFLRIKAKGDEIKARFKVPLSPGRQPLCERKKKKEDLEEYKTIAGEYGHAENHSWVSGKLVWSQLEGGFWKIKYLSRKGELEHFVLGRPKKLGEFKSEEWIRITGKVCENQLSFYMAGTLYCMKTVKRLRPKPTPPVPSKDEARLVAAAEKMKTADRRFPDGFKPYEQLGESRKRRWTHRLTVVDWVDRSGWHPVRHPHLINDFEEAKKKVYEKVGKHHKWLVEVNQSKDKKVPKEEFVEEGSEVFYHRFETIKHSKRQGVVTWSHKYVYLVLKASFLTQAKGRPASWIGNGGDGLVLGARATQDVDSFSDAADLLAYLSIRKWRHNTARIPYLVEREVRNDGEKLVWEGVLAHYIKSPTSDRDWKLERFKISADVKSGKVAISVSRYQ